MEDVEFFILYWNSGLPGYFVHFFLDTWRKDPFVLHTKTPFGLLVMNFIGSKFCKS